MLQACQKAETVKRVIYTSSTAVSVYVCMFVYIHIQNAAGVP